MKTSQFIAALSEAMLKYGDLEFSDLFIKAIKYGYITEGEAQKEQLERHKALQKIQPIQFKIIKRIYGDGAERYNIVVWEGDMLLSDHALIPSYARQGYFTLEEAEKELSEVKRLVKAGIAETKEII